MDTPPEKLVILKLHFVGEVGPSLFQTEFVCGAHVTHAVRGKTSGAFLGRGTFHWSSAVRGMCVLGIRTCLATQGAAIAPMISGGKGSLAASLDYAISKETYWLRDIFGQSLDSEGDDPTFRKMFRRSNSGRKRPGPVAVALSDPFQEMGAIQFTLNSRPVHRIEDLSALLKKIGDDMCEQSPQEVVNSSE